MTEKQPEALMLASMIERYNNGVHSQALVENYSRAAAELRRLHEVNADLVEALKEIADWTERYTTPGHPISTVARNAIAKATGGIDD